MRVEKQRKWTGWIIIGLLVAVTGIILVMTNQVPETSIAEKNDTQSNQPMTANASVIGYGGPVLVRVTLDNTGAITALDIGGERFLETEGIGSRVKEPSFAQQFMGQTPPLQMNDIDAATGATLSSTAVLNAVNEAAAYLKQK